MRWTREFFAVVAGCLLATIGVGIAYGGSWPPIGFLPPAALGGLVSLAICGLVVHKSRRPLTSVDLVRILCWVSLGSCCVTWQIAVSQYSYFWPRDCLAMRYLATIVGVLALTAIVVTRVLYPPPPATKPGCCGKCGYDLTGNVSGVCPECGERI
jgi:hypothetical protein